MLLFWVLLVIFIAVVVLIYLENLPKGPVRAIPELKTLKAKLVYTGTDDSEILQSLKHKIRAKPDYIYKLADGNHIIIEYKSQRNMIRDADVSQLIAGAIAASSAYPNIVAGYVYTRKNRVKKDFTNKTEDDLAQLITDELNQLRAIQLDHKPSNIKVLPRNCAVCPYKLNCDQRIT